MKKITTKCAFCGRETNYFFQELNCYICPSCLGEYKSALMRNKWFYYDGSSTYPYIDDGSYTSIKIPPDTCSNEIKIDSVDYDKRTAVKEEIEK